MKKLAANLVCIPLIDEDEISLLRHAEVVKDKTPDFIEWRIDFYNDIYDIKKILNTIKKLRQIIGNISLIFTCRCKYEGGNKEIDNKTRYNLIKEVVSTGCIDIVDIEAANEESFIIDISKIIKEYNCRLILSYHNFLYTPAKVDIINRLYKAQEFGADIAKVAVMPKSQKDVLVLLNATLEAKESGVKIPIITLSMDSLGMMTRIVGGEYGSYLTYAMDELPSAPGQISIDDLRKIWKIMK